VLAASDGGGNRFPFGMDCLCTPSRNSKGASPLLSSTCDDAIISVAAMMSSSQWQR
jgi:hypothetical protein